MPMRQSPVVVGAAIIVSAVGNGVFVSDQNGAVPASGRISGWTLSRSFEPIADVEVALACPPMKVQRVMSDASGRFEFISPEGNCRVIARKEGYVEASFNGDPAPGGYGIAVRSGTTHDGIELQLTQGAIISGVISAGDGALPDGIRFQVMRREVTNGSVKLVPLAYAPVSQGGHFKTFPVTPGDYYVVASPAPAGRPGTTGGFAVTYFPGTPRVSDATLITVKEGDHREVNFRLVTAPTFTVSGVVYDPSGAPLRDVTVGVEFDTPPNWIRGSGRTGSDGGFSIAGLQDGSYVLHTSRKNAAGRQEIGEVHFDVNGADVQHLTVRMAVR